jgi:hemerythrin-like domain-containing protein
MRSNRELDRRTFMATASTAAVGAVAWCASPSRGATSENKGEPENPVTPAEDLMFEHGLLERVLLIYDEAARRLDSGTQVPAKLISNVAGVIRSFGEDYHEELEEQYIFPRLEKAGQHADLTKELRAQHLTGRQITGLLLDMTKGGTLSEPRQAADALRSFTRMYSPHISRENSVVFRTFHEIVPPREYAELGEQFEDKEHSLFGADGFEKTLSQIFGIEKELGIYDLARFTPATQAGSSGT